ncbi:alpha-methylacyl-CoA racemase [Litorivivens lipolytica]|uniref:Alpha-methylacyl-CoA racemase n=1 Tax=Litorivivens lipolytica TaxID=1524264 RepID=A0A7W4W1Z7_9GAMM|nr:CaiB/BaiF CoA-transferase family protein [Litorivivens lipolytica]MBB3045967.1 alpha-methylacyl-CoA racemase [Litorivivens lipolytica]
MSGPLTGIRIIEMAGIGPGPFAGMLLADMGADVIRIDRASGAATPSDITARGKRSLALDLKKPEAVELVLTLLESADAVFEGFRPGVMEKLGLGPEVCLARNPKLVYGRMTGWGQDGPLAQAAGHDINYIAVTGALAAIGRKQGGPVPPLNLVGDYGGGSLYLVMGMLAALLEAKSSGKGQVVDAAITDGVINMMTPTNAYIAGGTWSLEREDNWLDGGSHFYDTYECADGKYISIGSIEPQFYALLAEKLELDLGEGGYTHLFEKDQWPVLKQRIAERVRTKTRQEWCGIMEGSDVCFAPVLDMNEAVVYPHNQARGNYTEIEGVTQSVPAPRFSRTPSQIKSGPCAPGADADEILAEAGLSRESIESYRQSGALRHD